MADPGPSTAVIGAGPAGLMAAEVLARDGAAVTVFDRMPSVGRKFLLAGRGGLNLSHTEPLSRFLDRYEPASPALRRAVELFPPDRLIEWCEALGQPTFVGTSGRVFPVAMKASPLLRSLLARLAAMGVVFAPRHRWIGWDGDALQFETPAGPVLRRFDATVLALGGASWPQLGSDARWVQVLEAARTRVTPLRPANCGFLVDWTAVFRDRFEGQPLKNVALHFAGRSARGDLLVIRAGLEAGPIYALAAPLRETIRAQGSATIVIDLRPDAAPEQIRRRLAMRPARESLATTLRKALRLSPVAIGLLHEAALSAGAPLATLAPEAFGALLKAVPVRLVGVAPIEGAISTAGGVAADAVDQEFMLHARPGVFVAGEMLDWEAPTGGYLLQACFATGVAAGQGASRWLDRMHHTGDRARPHRLRSGEPDAHRERSDSTGGTMRDYTLAIGNQPAYGFSAATDGAAVLHAIDYLDLHATPACGGIALAGPDGVLTQPSEDVRSFRERVSTFHAVENTDDVRPADPTPPDCNVG